jgi:protein-tyrosine kinase
MSKLKKALERAKESRENGQITGRRSKSSPSFSLRMKDKKNPNEYKEISIQYSKTKILDIDPKKLKKSKIISHIKEDRASEQINVLRTQILRKLEEINGNTLMVTSAHPGEGKTFTSINLGVSIAQELNKTVLLVDCDLRRPDSTHFDFATDFFGLKVEQGLSDFLLGQAELEDILLNPGIARLTILPGGRSLLNSSELLGSLKMESLVKEMKNRYGSERIIIFDSPSILGISDPLTFARFVDAILLVVEAKRTTPADLRKVTAMLKGRNIIGTVLNKLDTKQHV